MPTDSTALIMAATLGEAEPLPRGEFWFQPPLVLNGAWLRGSASGWTVLRPLPNGGGPLIVFDGQSRDTGGLERIRIKGSGPDAGEYGLVLRGACYRFRGVSVTECAEGVRLEWSVDTSFVDLDLHGNHCNLHAVGDGTGGLSVTTTRFRDSRISRALWTGAYIEHGWGLVFDCCNFESNAFAGMEIRSYGIGGGGLKPSVDPVALHDCWFEANSAGDVVTWNEGRTERLDNFTFIQTVPFSRSF